MRQQDFIAFAKDRVTEEMCRTIVTSALHYDGAHVRLGSSPETQYFWDKAINRPDNGLLTYHFQLETPIVGTARRFSARWRKRNRKRLWFCRLNNGSRQCGGGRCGQGDDDFAGFD